MPLAADIIDRTIDSKEGSAGYDVVTILADAGHEAWWVGGGVRDMLLGKIPKDIDIATSATPAEVAALFPKNDDSAAALGAVVVSHKGVRFEITTFREEGTVSDGRHPESVHFGTREQDSVRRDLTVNAVYWQPVSQELFDPHGGERDTKERLVRFIGDPGVRMRHDALRMLRAVRFRALLSGQYHPDTYRALQENAALTGKLSGSRQLAEFEKTLAGPHVDRALEDLWETGILKYVIPELYACRGVAQPAEFHAEGDVWNHTRRLAGSFTDDHGADIRIAAVFHDCGKVQTFSVKERIRFDHHARVSADLTKAVLARMQMSSKRIEKICWLIGHHMMMGTFFAIDEARKAHWYHHPWFAELLQLFWLDIAGTEPSDFQMYDKIVDDYNAFLDSHPRPAKPLLTGEEIMGLLGIGPGEEVGRILKALHDEQTAKRITKKAEAREFLLRHKA